MNSMRRGAEAGAARRWGGVGAGQAVGIRQRNYDLVWQETGGCSSFEQNGSLVLFCLTDDFSQIVV